MRFDAYAGTVWESHGAEVAEMVSWKVKGQVARVNPRARYAEAFEVKVGPQAIGWTGTDRTLKAAYFEFKGEPTPHVVSALRQHWPEAHGVSRLDACEDYNAPGAFHQLVQLVDTHKADSRVTSDEIRPRDGDRGATVYWGSRTSRALVRAYEKGKQKENLALGKPHWARIEMQLRPGKAVEKQICSKLDSVQAWGLTRWTQRVAQALTTVDVERFAAPQQRPTFDRTTAYIARTFRRHLEEMLADVGDWECVGREFGAVWRADDDDAAKRGRE